MADARRVLALIRAVVLDKPLWRSTDGPVLVRDWASLGSDLPLADAPPGGPGTAVHSWWSVRRNEKPMDWTCQTDVLGPNGTVHLGVLDLAADASGDVEVRLVGPPDATPRGRRRWRTEQPILVPFGARPRRDRFSLGTLDVRRPVRVHLNYRGFTSLFAGGQTTYADVTYVLCLDDGRTDPGQLLGWGVEADDVRLIDLRTSLH